MQTNNNETKDVSAANDRYPIQIWVCDDQIASVHKLLADSNELKLRQQVNGRDGLQLALNNIIRDCCNRIDVSIYWCRARSV